MMLVAVIDKELLCTITRRDYRQQD